MGHWHRILSSSTRESEKKCMLLCCLRDTWSNFSPKQQPRLLLRLRRRCNNRHYQACTMPPIVCYSWGCCCLKIPCLKRQETLERVWKGRIWKTKRSQAAICTFCFALRLVFYRLNKQQELAHIDSPPLIGCYTLTWKLCGFNHRVLCSRDQCLSGGNVNVLLLFYLICKSANTLQEHKRHYINRWLKSIPLP